ncbi:hypothetical protein RJ639_024647 [Escallonia herrerae]|uniref:PPM-type phosphatase domain-containing protein n=1 Tax=Escallonia herrerae TaxID=1293975 RepID=A0AA88V0U1_9ASTE|nr:hypothetical protein RJ639_024647 [Escallonia herrerae]
MASKLLLDYYNLHAVFGAYSLIKFRLVSTSLLLQMDILSVVFFNSHLSPVLDEETVHKILKEPVQKAIQEIEIEFTTEALKNNYIARSTATVALLLDDRATRTWNYANMAWKYRKLKAEELSRDHHPDRANERAWIEAAGGFVRVHASTALSRSCELLAM